MRIVSSIFFCITFFHISHSCAMLTLSHIMQKDYGIRPQVYNYLSLKDQCLFRSVCKTWAYTDPEWNFIPSDVKIETDRCIQKHEILTKEMQSVILAKCIAANNYDSVKWILKITTVPSQVFTWQINKQQHILDTLTLAKSNNNKEIARLLIKHQYTLSKNESWQDCYEKIKTPPLSQQLFTSCKSDFTFFNYLSSILIDDTIFIPPLSPKLTQNGLQLLLEICCMLDSIRCFNHFLKHNKAYELIIKHKKHLINYAQESKSLTILKKLEALPQDKMITSQSTNYT
jgi:hypothetical protein